MEKANYSCKQDLIYQVQKHLIIFFERCRNSKWAPPLAHAYWVYLFIVKDCYLKTDFWITGTFMSSVELGMEVCQNMTVDDSFNGVGKRSLKEVFLNAYSYSWIDEMSIPRPATSLIAFRSRQKHFHLNLKNQWKSN